MLNFNVSASGRAPRMLLPLLLMLLLGYGVAFAGSRISNVILEVDQDGRGLTEITNLDAAPLGYVVTPLSWKIIDGRDVYEKTSDFIAIPPSFQLGPNETKAVRVGFRKSSRSEIERTYRLSIREVPSTIGSEGVALVYDHLVPVFIAPAAKVALSELHCSVRKGEDGSRHLKIENSGNRRTTIRAIRLKREGKIVFDATSNQWSAILAKTWREVPLDPISVTAGSMTVEVTLVSGQINTMEIMIP